VKSLSKGMVVQAHLALVAAIDAQLMILDEPTLGLDVLSRKSFYEMLIDEWCDGERSVLISTHQVEEIETLLSDVMMLNSSRWGTTSPWPPRWPPRTRCCATARTAARRQSSTAPRPPTCWRAAAACGRASSTCSSR
jgi:energy-coupling factor transporter ATP-binding protein EcfA2